MLLTHGSSDYMSRDMNTMQFSSAQTFRLPDHDATIIVGRFIIVYDAEDTNHDGWELDVFGYWRKTLFCHLKVAALMSSVPDYLILEPDMDFITATSFVCV
jgi:hypothetical protein